MRLKESEIDIGIVRVGRVPESWRILRIKDVVTEMFLGQTPEYDYEIDHGNVIIGQRNNQLTGLNFSETKHGTKRFYEKLITSEFLKYGDVLLNTLGGGSVGRSGFYDRHDDEPVATDGHVMVIRTAEYESKFLFYYLRSRGAELEKMATGSTNQSFFNLGDIANLPIPCPPDVSTQRRIVAYLDEKTAAIDARVAVLEKKLAAYKRLKTSVINRAVTRGLDPKAKLKDSGVDWIGKVPVGWEVKNFTHCCQFFKGLAITKADLTETGTPVISYGQIHSKINTGTHLKSELLRYIPEALAAADPGARLKVGDIVFADTSEDVEGCGNCVLMDAEFPVYAGYHAIVARPEETGLSHYLSYLFNSPLWRSQIRSKVAGIKVFSVTQRIFKGVSVLLPSTTEANAIADYLDAECAKIDRMAALVTREIALYKDLKRSLVNEVVTGKREPGGSTAPTERGGAKQGRGAEEGRAKQGRGKESGRAKQGRGKESGRAKQGRGEESGGAKQGRGKESGRAKQGRGEEAAQWASA